MGHISESSVKALLPPHVSPKRFEWNIPSAGPVAPQDLAVTLLPQGWYWLALMCSGNKLCFLLTHNEASRPQQLLQLFQQREINPISGQILCL